MYVDCIRPAGKQTMANTTRGMAGEGLRVYRV